MTKTTIAVLAILLGANSFAQTKIAGTTKATATLTASCRVSAKNVNFGVLDLNAAKTGQQASSSMDLFCSKGISFTVALNYGYTSSDILDRAAGGDYYRFVNHVNVGRVGWLDPANPPAGYVYDPTGKTMDFYLVSQYGTMSGATKGDGIAYKITVPGDDSSYWSGGSTVTCSPRLVR